MDKLEQSRKERSTACFYDKSYWDEYWKGRFSGDEKEAKKRMNFVKNSFPGIKKILDAGCGLGYVVAVGRSGDYKYDICGIDISEAAIKRAPVVIQKYLKIGNITDLPYEDDSFELVTCFDIFEHLFIEEIFKAIKEVCRVAKKYILMRSPVVGWRGERCIADHSYRDKDRSHISVYPWDFWVRQFIQIGKFRFCRANMYCDKDYDGYLADI
jgi:ubiquinone/menaquinone biosynthesis C-methylase UbiE